MCIFDLVVNDLIVGCDEPSIPTTRMSIHICPDMYVWVPGIYGPSIYGYRWTRYPWVSVDQFSLGPGPAPWPRPFSLGPGPARAPLMEADRASRRVFSMNNCVFYVFS